MHDSLRQLKVIAIGYMKRTRPPVLRYRLWNLRRPDADPGMFLKLDGGEVPKGIYRRQDKLLGSLRLGSIEHPFLCDKGIVSHT